MVRSAYGGARPAPLHCVTFRLGGGDTGTSIDGGGRPGDLSYMRPFDYLRILQRRWWIPVLGLLVGLLLAFVTQPSELSVAIKTAPRIQYRAQHLLISNPTNTER